MRQQYSTQLAVAAGVLILVASIVFALVQSPELLEQREAAAVKSAAAIPHGIRERSRCGSCHALKADIPYPLKHGGWSTASCTKCHESVEEAFSSSTPRDGPPITEREKSGARPIPHALENMKNCTVCHGLEGDIPYPENHAGRDNSSCVNCHSPTEEKEIKNT